MRISAFEVMIDELPDLIDQYQNAIPRVINQVQLQDCFRFIIHDSIGCLKTLFKRVLLIVVVLSRAGTLYTFTCEQMCKRYKYQPTVKRRYVQPIFS